MPAQLSAGRSALGMICLFCGFFGSEKVLAQVTIPEPRATKENVLAVVQGAVEVSRFGSDVWTPGRLNQILHSGDKIRTGAYSRAEIYLFRGETVKLAPGSEIELTLSRPTLIKGSFHPMSREREPKSEFKLPSSIAAIRSTDFLVRILEHGLTELFVFDGTILLTNDLGSITLTNGLKGIVVPGEAPRAESVRDPLTDIIQWSLYYPVVLSIDELGLTPQQMEILRDSITAYKNGDLLTALSAYPRERRPANEAERAYRAALLLAVGELEEANSLIGSGKDDSPSHRALRKLIAAVKLRDWKDSVAPSTSAEWMAESYYQQFRSRLEEAVQAAKNATAKAPGSGFVWARLAELKFSFGQTTEAAGLLAKALDLSPRNPLALTLRGFVLAAQNAIPDAIRSFDEAISVDSALGYAWLGKGLCLIHEGFAEAGQRHLHIAASLEPHRGVFRSYLGKAFSNANDDSHAIKELEVAKALDSNDPTAWLYSALLNLKGQRINQAIRELQQSQVLNDNRSVFRSRLLLDQDAAVRSANLASIYQDAGMFETSLREAARAVTLDYANYSAHLFLANSYNALRDPRLISLRFETAVFSEYLMANLLAPVGAGQLSQYVSEQEYSRLFESDRFGLSSSTAYLSNGDWQQTGSQFGTIGNTGYAVDVAYRTENGQRPNSDLTHRVLSAQIKQEITAQDSLYLQAVHSQFESGDVRQLYSQEQGSSSLRIDEVQAPNLFVGYHHVWGPGIHTILLAGRLNDSFRLTQSDFVPTTLIIDDLGPDATTSEQVCRDFLGGTCAPFALQYRSLFEAYTAELQQIWQTPSFSLVIGGRYQTGVTETSVVIGRDAGLFPPIYDNPASLQVNSTDLRRLSTYAYNTFHLTEKFSLIGGLSYDALSFPENIDLPPISDRQAHREQVSPKLGVIWRPGKTTTVRVALTRSLGGLFYDASVRLEPTQVAGFNQAFRSLIPEAVEGSIAAPKFETASFGVDNKFENDLYVGAAVEVLRSNATRAVGVFDFFEGQRRNAVASLDRQQLEFEERSLTLNMNKLVGNELSFGARYRVSSADLKSRINRTPVGPNRDGRLQNEATLHQLTLSAVYNHPSGIFARVQSLWTAQSNHNYDPDIPGDDFWHFDAFVGYRFPRRYAEVTLGLLNITDRNYQLNPLNLYAELQRKRTIFASFRFNF